MKNNLNYGENSGIIAICRKINRVRYNMTSLFKKRKKESKDSTVDISSENNSEVEAEAEADIGAGVSADTDALPANRREHMRVRADLEATVRLNEEKYSAKIIDISAGGIKMVSEKLLPIDEIIPVEFMLVGAETEASGGAAVSRSPAGRLIALCKIVRMEVVGNENIYGAKFEAINEPNLKKINAFVFDTQVASRLN